jgi:hypothetical protein
MWLHNTPGSCGLVKRLDYGLRPDAESVLLPAYNARLRVRRARLAAKLFGARPAHRQKIVGRIAVEARLEFVGQPNAPRRPGVMLADNNAVVEQTMDRRGSETKRAGSLLDGQ